MDRHEFRLRSELQGHQEDVRTLLGCNCRFPTSLPLTIWLELTCMISGSRRLQVRAVRACALGLWTASRDKIIKLWTEVTVHDFVPSTTLVRKSLVG